MRALITTLPFISVILASATATALPSGFSKSRVVSGLSRPTAMAFAPDGRLFITERGTSVDGIGRVRIVKNNALLTTPFVSITVDNSTVGANERGLLGIALDPNFATNNFIYVYYTMRSSPPRNRISRFTANGDVAVSGSETVLLTLEGLSAGNHNGGGLAFGNDGKLYIAVGENAVATNSVNLDNHLGKILRLNADGSAPSDNPFFDSANGINARDRIYAFGLRNPFTLGVQRTTGRIFVNDVGQSTWEEIDDLVRGRDYGWRGGTTDGDSTCFHRYDRATGRTIAGGAFYNPVTPLGNFSSFVGKYFFGDYVDNWIRVINPADKVVTVFETGLSGPVDIDVASDGSLFYLNHSNGELWRVVSSGATTQSILLSANSMNVTENTSGTFTASLAAAPSANVIVNFARTSGDPSVTVSPTSVTFTPTNWSTPQTIRATSAEDTDSITRSAQFTASASGIASKTVVVNAVDNDIVGPRASSGRGRCSNSRSRTRR
jgi:glucose/arabinose dehydrogenase